MGALAPPPFSKVGGSTVCARAASRNYNWTIIYSKYNYVSGAFFVLRLTKGGFRGGGGGFGG